MQFLHSMIRVQNLENSLKFYCDILGLKEVSRQESEKGRFTLIFLAAEEDFERASEVKSPLIELTYNWPTENEAPEDYGNARNFGHLAFRVKDIYKTCEHIQNQGVTINRPPRDGYMAFLKSPDNISIELLQKGSPLPPKEPWASMENVGTW